MGLSWDIDLHFDLINADIEAKAPAVMLEAAEFMRSVVVPEVPVETGNLAGSVEARPGADTQSAEVYVPGPYARYQHYGLDFHHDHGHALYLEQPFVTDAGGALRIIADGILP